MSKYQTIIGRFEYVDINKVPRPIPAKIDTGAFRSSIHVSDIEEVTVKGKRALKFTVLGHPGHLDSAKVTTRKFNQVQVKSSNGHESTRYEVKLRIRLGYKNFITSFTLADRSSNAFPILIGRDALRNRFLVDVTKVGVKRAELIAALIESQLDQEETDELKGAS